MTREDWEHKVELSYRYARRYSFSGKYLRASQQCHDAFINIIAKVCIPILEFLRKYIIRKYET